MSRAGGDVLYGVDATALTSNGQLMDALRGEDVDGNEDALIVDKIVFNFPHTGCGIKDTERNVRHHQEFMGAFFRSARALIERAVPTRQSAAAVAAVGRRRQAELNDVCEVHVTLKRGPPYDSWGLPALAREAGLSLHRALQFYPEKFPGYEHRRTIGAVSADQKAAGHRLSLGANEDISKVGQPGSKGGGDLGPRTFVFGLPRKGGGAGAPLGPASKKNSKKGRHPRAHEDDGDSDGGDSSTDNE